MKVTTLACAPKMQLNFFTVKGCLALDIAMSRMRDKKTGSSEMNEVISSATETLTLFALNSLGKKIIPIQTPMEEADGYAVSLEFAAVIPILRAGIGMQSGVEKVLKQLGIPRKFGTIQIQRDESTALPIFQSAKIPKFPEHDNSVCIIPDIMNATGGSACTAIGAVIEHGCKEENILLLNLISAVHGLAHIHKTYPKVTLWTAMVNEDLNEKSYIHGLDPISGIRGGGAGDMGDRYSGT
ncbi:MAG: uracil phosphoribosyltransferase [Parcubacteria group bacterium]|nr:uracil phosphoribosyltransferase [Parcubacteria group bacterium]